MSERPLTDEEIAYKFECEIGSAEFESAKRISRFRPDRAISDWPTIDCPHCGNDFECLSWHERDLAPGGTIVCHHCDRTIYIENVERTATVLTLNTHPENERWHG